MQKTPNSPVLTASYPGYDVYTLAPAKDGMIYLTAGMEICDSQDHRSHHRLGSTVSYAMSNFECPIAALKQAEKHGHDNHWVFALGTSISDQQSKGSYYAVDTTGNTMYVFEGRLFTFKQTHNRNLALVPVED